MLNRGCFTPQISLVTNFQNLRIFITLERKQTVHVVSLEVVWSISIPLRRSTFSEHQKQLRMTWNIRRTFCHQHLPVLVAFQWTNKALTKTRSCDYHTSNLTHIGTEYCSKSKLNPYIKRSILICLYYHLTARNLTRILQKTSYQNRDLQVDILIKLQIRIIYIYKLTLVFWKIIYAWNSETSWFLMHWNWINIAWLQQL